MRKFLFIFTLIFSVCVQAQIDKILPNPQSPPRLYNDFTKGKSFLTPEQSEFLERKLVAYDDSTSNQVAIVIVETLNGYEANDYATQLGRKWGVGGREHNNGVVVLISTEPGNRDAYIAVGYGLEGAIPDITANRIVDDVLIPDLKNGDYYQGLSRTVDALIKAAAGEYTAPQGYGKKRGLKPWKIILIFFIVWTIIGIISRGGRGGGGYVSRRGYRGLGGPFWWGTGGGFGGGGWSGGGGGGFGGFGGGSFGGGGAGGKW